MGSRGQTQTTEQTVDPRITGMHTDLFNDVQQFMSANPQPLVAGQDPLSAQAQGLLSSALVNPSAATTGAQQVATDLAGFQAPNVGTPDIAGGIQGFLDPFTTGVIDTTLSDLDRARQLAQTGNAGAATQAGAFGGSRHAILEAETNRAFADQAARTAAQLRSQGFGQALDAATRQAGLGLQAGMANQGAALDSARIGLGAGGLLGQIGQNQFANMLAGTGLLGQFGAQNEARQQAILDDPLRRFQFQSGILSGIPTGMTITQSQPGNAGAGFAGGALTGAGIGASFGPLGAGIGALGGGLLGLF